MAQACGSPPGSERHVSFGTAVLAVPVPAPPPLDLTPAATSLLQALLIELSMTEDRFVADLRAMVETYLVPMRERGAALADPRDCGLLFSNVESLLQTHEALLELLPPVPLAGELMGPDVLGERVRSTARAFIALAPFLSIHAVYASNYEDGGLDALRRLERQAGFSRFCREASGLPLQALLIKPIQRLCKYHLFFERLRQAWIPSLVARSPLACGNAHEGGRESGESVGASGGVETDLREAEALMKRLADRINSTLEHTRTQVAHARHSCTRQPAGRTASLRRAASPPRMLFVPTCRLA